MTHIYDTIKQIFFMKLRHFQHFFFSSILLISMLGCDIDDNNDSTFDPCKEPLPGIAGVTQSDLLIEAINEPGNRGYLITATIANDTQESVDGFPSFVLRINGVFSTFKTLNSASASSCLSIEASSSCSYSTMFALIDQDGALDSNPEFLCFYYSAF